MVDEMDYDSHMRAAMQYSGLCNAVSYGEGQVGAMMALMTTDLGAETDYHRDHHPQHDPHQPAHHNTQGSPHQQYHNDQRQQLSILHSNTVSAASQIPPSFTYYNAAIVEPCLQSGLLQATHAFNQSHHVETHTPIISALDHLEPSTVIFRTEEEKPDVGAPKAVQGAQLVGGRDCSYVITTSVPMLLVSPSANSMMHESRAAVGRVSMEVENTHSSAEHSTDLMRAKIVSHGTYPCLVMAYVNCHKIGAPAEVVSSLDEISKKYQTFRSSSPAALGADPELDHFMETYCNVLQKYHDELMQPYKEAMAFFRMIELQLNSLSKGTLRLSQSGDEKGEANAQQWANTGGSSVEEEVGDASCREVEFHKERIDPLAEDQKLKEQLLRKYSGSICSLKQEFLKKKKKGKLPKDARQKLLAWWSQHYKWPYPSEAEKAGLAESTGLDQTQINSWFINQRRRHWKPSEYMQYVMVDNSRAHHHHLLHAHAPATDGHLAPHSLTSYAVVKTMDAAAGAAAAAAAMILPTLH